MTYFYAFLFCGLLCAISQYILEKTNLTSGHMNTILVIFGCALSGFGIYDKIIGLCCAGATVPIVNFGHLLVTGASAGYKASGFLGLIKGLFDNAGAGLTTAIVCAFIVTLLFKPRN